METLQELAAAIDRKLLDGARRNELIIAYVRALSIGPFVPIHWVGYCLPERIWGSSHRPLGAAILVTVAFFLAVGLMIGLRRGWYHTALRLAMPVYDALWIMVFYLNLRSSQGFSGSRMIDFPAQVALTGALVIATGGLRLSWRAAAVATGCGVSVVAILNAGTFSTGGMIGVIVLLLGMGGIAMWMTEIVRRNLKSEVSRVILERFLPSKVILGAWREPMSLLTKPRSLDATVVVSDLRGFTAIAEHMTPVEVLQFLNEVQGMFANAVRTYGGTVDKFMGDGMLAVFGAPEPDDTHAQKAVSAVLAMRDGLAKLNVQRDLRALEPIDMRVGVHSGLVVTGCIGSGARLEFTIIGDTVNMASRLEGLAKERGVEVLISEETVKRLPIESSLSRLAIPLEALGEVVVRGRERPIGVYCV